MDGPENYSGGAFHQSIARIFLLVLLLVLGIFFGYELLERLWLEHAFPGYLDAFHVMRGVGTALIVSCFIVWYFVGVRPHQTARQIFLNSPLPTEQEQRRWTRQQLVEWMIRLRWLVSAVFILGLILTVTVSRSVLWEANFLILLYLSIALVISNVIYGILIHYELFARYHLYLQIVVDFVMITLFLHMTGGIYNPSFILYLPHVLITALVSPPVVAYFFAFLSLFLLGGLGFLHYMDVLTPHTFTLLHLSRDVPTPSGSYLVVILVMFGGVVFSTSFLTSLMMRLLREYQVNLREEKLNTQNFLDEVMTAREDERARISRELHDQIGQSLSTVRLKLSQLKGSDEHAREGTMDSLESTVENAIDDVRDLSRNLRPSSLDECGLPCAIENYAEEIEHQHDIEIDYEWIGLNHSRNFSREVDTALYRVAQEAVMNAVEHANPSRICIILQFHTERIQLLVEDDGKGFDKAILSRGSDEQTLGIRGMRERIDRLAGRFDLETSPGTGTRVRVEVPLSDADNDTDE